MRIDVSPSPASPPKNPFDEIEGTVPVPDPGKPKAHVPDDPDLSPGRRRRHRRPRARKAVLVAVSLAVFFVLGFAVGMQWGLRSADPMELTEQVIIAKIEDCSDLTTSKLSYNGFVKYEQGSIPFIDRKAFGMRYSADIEAGVDLSQAEVTVSGRTIRVDLPAAEVQSVKIDPYSIGFYDSEFSLFAWDNKQDTVTALTSAQDDVEANVDTAELLARADEQAAAVIEDMLSGLTLGRDGYSVEVTTMPRPTA